MNNPIVSIGDLILALPKYHEAYATYKWHTYSDFIIGEVVGTKIHSFDITPVEFKHSAMNFGNDWIVPVGNYLPYFQKLYVKQS